MIAADTLPFQQSAIPSAATRVAGPTGPLRDALWISIVFGIVKFSLHVAVNLWQKHLGWGYFLDEPYYILCGRFLDWGYVDHGPVVALQARTAVALFGKSLAGIRMFSALAGGVEISLTGILAWQMGARRTGQVLAMLAALLAPEVLGLDSYLSMNSFEPLFWTMATLAILRLLAGNSPRWWIVFGVAAGIGCENKPSMVFFLAALLLGLLITPQRRVLGSRWMWAGLAIGVALVLPNLIWQSTHAWAMLRFLHTAHSARLGLAWSPAAFLAAQVVMLNPVALIYWGGGLLWLLISERARPFRFIGWTYLCFLVLMFAAHAKEYYLTPIYPLLFAAGGCWVNGSVRLQRMRWVLPCYCALLIVTGIAEMPITLPILRPQTTAAFARATRLDGLSRKVENTSAGPLTYFYSLRFGSQEMVDQVTQIFHSLSPTDQAQAGILCSDYGAASAINFQGDGRGLPFAISGHNNYYLWGPHGETGSLMIVVTDAPADALRPMYASVELVGREDHPYAPPHRRLFIYLCRGRKQSLLTEWPTLRHYN